MEPTDRDDDIPHNVEIEWARHLLTRLEPAWEDFAVSQLHIKR